MEELMEVLEGLRPDVDFAAETVWVNTRWLLSLSFGSVIGFHTGMAFLNIPSAPFLFGKIYVHYTTNPEFVHVFLILDLHFFSNV